VFINLAQTETIMQAAEVPPPQGFGKGLRLSLGKPKLGSSVR
jgi:hypothetical protein